MKHDLTRGDVMTAVREAASPTHARIGYAPVKRALDAALAATGLIALAPLMLLLAVAIKLESRGPTLYRGTRVGLNGRDFTMLKFRTMIIGAERGPSSTSADDHRITRVGAVLRRFKLDELPQMLNVLRGDMSLVGPRPQVRWAVDLYRPEERLLLSVRPGITDYASIRYRNEAEILRGSPDPDEAYLRLIAPGKMRLGLHYVRTSSLAVDVRLILATLCAVFGGDPTWCLPEVERNR